MGLAKERAGRRGGVAARRSLNSRASEGCACWAATSLSAKIPSRSVCSRELRASHQDPLVPQKPEEKARRWLARDGNYRSKFLYHPRIGLALQH